MKPARYQANKDGRYWPELSIALPSFHSFQPPQFYSTEAYILKNMQASYPPSPGEGKGKRKKKGKDVKNIRKKRNRCKLVIK